MAVATINDVPYLRLLSANGHRLVHRVSSAKPECISLLTETFGLECEALKQISHPSLPRLLRNEIEGNQFSMVLEYVDCVSLAEYVTGARQAQVDRPFDLHQVLAWARQLADAVLYLHRQRPFSLFHRELTPVTIGVVAPGQRIRLIHLGLPNSLNPKYLVADGTHSGSEFRVPGQLDRYWSHPSVDIYSFGKILQFLLKALPSTDETDDDSTAAQHIGEALSAIAGSCVSNAATAYQSMDAVVEHLQSLNLVSEVGTEGLCGCGQANRPSARFCSTCGRSLHANAISVQAKASWDFVYDAEGEASLISSFRNQRFVPLTRYRMMESIHTIESDPGFDELLSLANLPEIAKMQHQKDAVLRALKQMRGRALLADEVGLGKTVEAGIFLKELLLRRLADKVLILCPSILLAAQWQSELYDKFGEITLVFGHDIDSSLAWECSRLIATYETLRHPFHAEEILRQRYDLVVLDEAHFLNEDEHADMLATVRELQKKYFLMLSATPMHRSLKELYKIVTLLRPGHFADEASFEREFMEAEDEMRAKNVGTLRGLLHQIMVRNRREDITDYVFPRRRAVPKQLQLLPDARTFYDQFRDFLKQSVTGVSNPLVLAAVGDLAERLCSSPDAFTSQINAIRRNRRVRQVLGDSFLQKLAEFGVRCPESIVQPKLDAAIETLVRHSQSGERALAFSQFDETANYFFRRLQATGLKSSCFLYDPRTSLAARQTAVRGLEQTRGGILICPGEASEGLNLQVASLMVNLDLPWNPMKLEQRIGRIQRIGGKKDVLIVNLILLETIEEKIYEICERRIQMFEAIVGHVEEILGNLEEDIEVLIRDFYLDRQTISDQGDTVSAEENLARAIDEAEAKSSKPAEECLSYVYGSADFDPSTAEECE
jgi:superfamily II DNA or RNA helicase